MTDERKESGEFYPGGRETQGGGGSGGGGDTVPRVPVTQVEELPERYRESDMRSKINQLCRIVSGGVAAFALMVAANSAEVTVQGARKDALYNDDFVVTNVTVALDGLVTTNQLEGAANAVKTELKGEIAGATNAVAAELIGKIAGATNAVAGERAAALAPYATKDWVAAQGFADGSALEGYATQGWVTEQGYAPKSWVEGRGYMMGTNLAPYATKEWVEGRGYATGTNLADATEGVKGWVQGQGYATRTEVENVQAVIGPTVRAEVGEAVRDIVYERDVAQRVEAMEEAPGQTNGWRWGTWIDGAKEYWNVNGIWDGTNLVGLVTNVTDLASIEEVDYAVADALESATNYTQKVAEGLSNLSNALERGEMQVWNAWSSQDSQHANYADVAGALSDGTSQRSGAQIFTQLDAASRITTNDVCAIVTNEVSGISIVSVQEFDWVEDQETLIDIPISSVISMEYVKDGTEIWDDGEGGYDNYWMVVWQTTPGTTQTGYDPWDGEGAQTIWPSPVSAGDYGIKITMESTSRNALGLARLPDITNTVTKAYVEDLGIESGIQFEEDPHWEAAKGGYATTGTVAQVSEAVGTLWSYVYGDSVWIAVTNYMRTVGGVSPSFQLWEVRDGVTNLVYWSKEEITNVTHDLIHDCKTNLEATVRNAVAEMPDKAWSKYQSATGNEAPEGVTIVSTPTIQLTGGGEWYRYIDVASNSVWFLKSNGLHTFGGDTNGYFRILDDEGNATFEVRKTDSYLVDAVASSVHFDADGNFCVSFQSNVQPVIYTTATLEHPNFLPQGEDPNVTVTWTQSGGVYTAKLEQAVKGPSLFAYAKVEVLGETVIRNTVPTDLQGGIMLNGVKYSVGTAMIDNKTVLTLTPRN